MKKSFYLVVIAVLCFNSFTFAQKKSIEGDWILSAYELNDVASDVTEIPIEESFFAHYQDATEVIAIKEGNFPMFVGGDFINYTYEIKANELVLKASNVVYVLKDNKQENLDVVGETSFTYKLFKNKLILTRRNDSFFESYTFTK